MGSRLPWLRVGVAVLAAAVHGAAFAAQRADDATVYRQSFSSKGLRRLGLNVDTATKAMVLALKAKLCPDCDLALRNRSVAEMRVLDLNGDGKKDLIALTNDVCTADPNGVFLVCSVPAGYIVQMIFTEWAVLDETLRDIDGDGKYEIVTNSCIAGAACHLDACLWRDIHAWTKEGYALANRRFLESYYLTDYLGEVSDYIARAQERLKLLPGDDNGKAISTAAAMLQDARTAIAKVAELSKQRAK